MAPRSIPLGPILCLLGTTCGLNSVRRAVPAEAVPVRTALYMDDRSVISSSAESLSHHKNAWSQWSGHVGLIENESKVSLAVKSPNCPSLIVLRPSFGPLFVSWVLTLLLLVVVCVRTNNNASLRLLEPSRYWLQFNFPFESSICMLLCSPCLRRHTVGSPVSLLSLPRFVFGPMCAVVTVNAS